MHIPSTRSFIGTDRQQGRADVITFADISKTLEVGTVPAVIKTGMRRVDQEAAKAAMDIVNHPRSPVVGGSEDNFRIPHPVGIPVIHLADFREVHPPHQPSHSGGNEHRLSIGNAPQGRTVQVIKVSVSHQHQINLREIDQVQTGMACPLHRSMPHRPVGINDQIQFWRANEKGGVTDPGHLDFMVFEIRINRLADEGPLALAQDGATVEVVEPAAVLAIASDGSLTLDATRIQEGMLVSYLKVFREQFPTRKLELEPDKGIPLERFIQVQNALIQAGLNPRDVPSRVKIPESSMKPGK